MPTPKKNISYQSLKDSLESANVSLELDYLIAVYRVNAPNFDIVNIPGYAEIVRINKNDIQISPITNKFLAPLRDMKYYAKQEKRVYFKDTIPPSLIYVNTLTGDMIWKMPAKKYKLNSTIVDFCGEANFPDLIAMVRNHELYVYAFNPESNYLYVLSIPHYEDENGWVCLGQVKKSFEIEEMISNYNHAWEKNAYSNMSHTTEDEGYYKELWSNTYFNSDPWDSNKFKHLEKCQETIQSLKESII